MTKLVVEALGSGDESARAMRNNESNKKKNCCLQSYARLTNDFCFSKRSETSIHPSVQGIYNMLLCLSCFPPFLFLISSSNSYL